MKKLCVFAVLFALIGSVRADLLNGWTHPSVVFNPSAETYGSLARKYQGIPTIATAGGRLWAAWYAGPVHEDQYTYVVASTSGDDGKTWSDIKFAIDPDGDGPKRNSDPCLWLDPSGRLWLFWWLCEDGLNVTMAITAENPDDEHPVWSAPKPLFPGVMLNKPIVTKTGEWIMPSAIWRQDNSCRVVVSKDQGKTWTVRGAANVPPSRRQCDEHMIVEKNDGSLWMLVRTKDFGIGEAVSTDGGQTWTEVSDYLHHATSRFFIGRLNSGALLLIKHGKIDERTPARSHLTAYLSLDDGVSWEGGLVIDERVGVSYPDAVQAPDGTIFAIYDWNRADQKNILMTTFTEQDVLSKAYVSAAARSRVLVNQAKGINSKPWKHKTVQEMSAADVEIVPFEPGMGAVFDVQGGTVETLAVGAEIFADRNYTFYDLPEEFIGQPFVCSSITSTKATCVSPGMVYVLTPAAEVSPDSREGELIDSGFKKTSIIPFPLFAVKGLVRKENTCSVFQKHVEAGDVIRFGKWGVLACSAVKSAASRLIRVACIGDSITMGYKIAAPEKNSYPAQLLTMLGEKYCVENFGVSGATLLKKGDRPYWETSRFKPAHDFQPDVVVMMLGTNDLKPKNRTHLDEYVKDYLSLIDSFRQLSSSPEILICYPPPSYRPSDITDENIVNVLIPLIRDVSQRAGVSIIDTHKILKDQIALFPDRLHPDKDGAAIIAEAVCSAVSQ